MGVGQPAAAGPAAGDTWAAAYLQQHGRGPTLRERVEFNTEHAMRAPHRAAVAALGRLHDVHGAEWISPFAPDREVRRLAEQRAELLGREVDAWPGITDTGTLARWLAGRVAQLGARPFTWPGDADGLPPPPGTLGPMLARARCPLWWRRQLRRAVVRARETLGMHRGEVCKRAGQVYCTDDTLHRRRERAAADRALLEATEIESQDGQVLTLAQAADASTASKPIRRGELMTRVRGCMEWAEAAGMVGIFTTNTTPSRFHAQTMHGGANPRHDGSTPRQAQGWLCDTWARCRAKLQRMGVKVYGFRVAEPHHDGCPHWHMLLWCPAGDLARLQATMRAAWLADAGDEPGAQLHRFKSVAMEGGGAAAYIAKYVAKNIDDAGAVAMEGHRDEDQAGQVDWVGTGKAQRVEAWAAAWGIRQFQAIGQPPVTVWRELRRIDAAMVAGAHPDIRRAHEAVNRDGSRRACWRTYMEAQGGAMVGRGYRVRIARSDDEPGAGRYGDELPARPVGVEHAERPGEWCLSERKQWKPRGTWAEPAGRRGPPQIPYLGEGLKAPRPPWTRVNNCTAERPRGGFSLRQLAAHTAQHGPLRVVLAERHHPPAPHGATT